MSYTVLAHSKQDLCTKKRKPNREHRCGASQISSECQVRISHNSRVPELGWIMHTCFLRYLGFYSGLEMNYYTCVASPFHIGKILTSERIFQNLLCIRILFVLGFYGLGLTVGRKSCLFRISWGPHNEQLSATWPFGSSIPFVCPCRIRLLLAHLLSRPSIQSDPFIPCFIK